MTTLAHADRSRIQTRLAPEEDPEFQIAPMIDILLVLLVFFMSISSTEVLQRSEDVRLPVADNAIHSHVAEGQLIINVLWSQINNSGSIRMDDVAYARAEQIAPTLRTAVEVNPRTRVVIRADKNVRYEYLRQVMKAAGDAGVGNVTFSVVNRDEP
jgi:biopolymer transport protein ExbD